MNFEKDVVITHLFNRKSYDDCLKTKFNEANTTHPLSLVIVDIDHFKHVNDTYGHQNGDQILKIIGEIIHPIIESKGYAFRYGGEELVVLLPNFSLEEAKAVADRIRITVENHMFALTDQKNSINCTVSIGISMYPDGVISTEEELFKRADDALYEAKNSGRNQVCVAEPGVKVEKKKQVPSLEAECISSGSKCYILRNSEHLFIILQLKIINRSSQPTTVQIKELEVLINGCWKTAERSNHSRGNTINDVRSTISADYCATLKPYEDIRLEARDTKPEYLAFILKESVALNLDNFEVRGRVEDFDGRTAMFNEIIQRYR